MRRKILSLVSVLLIVCMAFVCFGCAGTGETAPLQTEPADSTSEAQAGSSDTQEETIPEESLVSAVAPEPEDTVTLETTSTEEPTSEPEPTEPAPTPETSETPEAEETPTATPVPQPNPYVGVWTIEDLPFSLEFRSDGTYLIMTADKEKEGTYSFDTSRVLLSVAEGQTVEMNYYSKADTLKVGDLKLIRDELVFFFELETIPISYSAENDDLRVSVRGSVVEARAKDGRQIGQYCFTKADLTPPQKSRDWFDASDTGEAADLLRVFKYDGEYTLWTRDANGDPIGSIRVIVNSGMFDRIDAKELEVLHEPFGSMLKNEGSSVDEFNRTVSRYVAASGIQTRAGVVAAAVSLCSGLAQYGYMLPCQGHGSYQGAREWGANPKWGARTDETGSNGTPEYCGMHSAASIIWAYKQAGLNLYPDADTTIVMLGERKRARDNKIDYDRAEPGDIIKNGNRYMMVVDRLDQNGNGEDDAYLVYEMTTSGLSIAVLTFKQARGKGVYSMDAFFSDSGRNTRKVNYWKDSFRIPVEDMPPYLQEAMEQDRIGCQFYELLEKLGV